MVEIAGMQSSGSDRDSRLPGSRDEILDVLVIGAGFSGVCAGIKLLEAGINNFRIVEKSSGIGGTWYDNTYPGAACDVPSHFYCYSFEPNPNWSRIYSPGAEIQQYIEHCVDKYGIRPYLINDARVVEMTLDEEAALWEIIFADGRHALARHVINGAGGLHKPSIPDFLGRETFAGPAMHTARWDHSVDLANRHIAVIGSAASAIQVIPEAAKVAASVTVFQRTPNYIVPRGDRDFTDAEKRRFERWPWLQRLYRWWIYKRMDLLLYPITKKGSMRGRHLGRKVIRHMHDSIADPGLRTRLEPDYAMGCKRILLSDDLFAAMNRDNVSVVTESIDRIEPAGIRTVDGKLHAADVIVYATGFDIDGHIRSINVVGQGGRTLEEVWGVNQEAYNGCCVAGFPNYWMVTGPNTGVGTTSVVFMVEQMIAYILKLIAAAGPGTLISVRQAPQDAYNRELQSELAASVWASGCKSWYFTNSGRITTLYPRNAAAFRRQLRKVRLENFELSEARRSDQAA